MSGSIFCNALSQSLVLTHYRHREEILKHGNIDEAEVERVKYLHEFDRAIQCPTWGYPTEDAYYRDAASADSVFSIRIPTLCVHAEDDPVCICVCGITECLLT